jgi:putative ABC transport system permease protein
LEPDQAVSNIASMDEVLSDSVASRRFSTTLLGALAGLGLLLASIGVYGVISYGVAQRTREIGIRMALGATRRDVLFLVVTQGMKLLFIGVAAGTISVLLLTRVMSGLLFGVRTSDPATYPGERYFLIGGRLPGELHSRAARNQSRSDGGAPLRVGRSRKRALQIESPVKSGFDSDLAISCV